jgi:N-acetylmuramoyl-L-alanine amidase
MKALAALAATIVIGLMAFPMLLANGDAAPAPASCATGPGRGSGDTSPTILGPSSLTAADIAAWWTAQGKSQPPRLRAPIDEVIAAYLREGAAENVRGDLAFAQAVLETGWFTNQDTSINNFAGIGHYDNAASGFPFPTAAVGVRAQIQLLKKYVDGNDVHLASPDVSPNAGARATTWAQLAGRWATARNYWTELNSIYQSMVDDLEAPGGGHGFQMVRRVARVCLRDGRSSTGPSLSETDHGNRLATARGWDSCRGPFDVASAIREC